LRFGYKRLNIDAKELKNRNFSRMVKEDARISNVIEELEE
jgi:molybdenum cofactor biosynthesis enzyme MoaA